jgi:flagellar biogenesis protein FliO
MQIAEMVLGPASQGVAVAKRPPMPPIVEKAKNLLARLRKLVIPVTSEQKDALTISGRVSLGPKKSLVLVEVRGQSILVAMSGDSTPALMAIQEATSLEQKKQTVRKGRTSC